MVDIPTNVQQLLVCSKCDNLLQRGPVYLLHDGAAVCGPCQTSENFQPVVRCRIYEAAAQLLYFPCRYHENGCSTTVPFVADGSTEYNHEDACEYRQYMCPVLGCSSCEWKGPRNKMQQHCQEEHPSFVLPNPAVITPDIHQSQMTNYIIPEFGLLFLLHSRVCNSTAKLQYAVRLLGAPQLASNYSFVVTIQRGEIIYKQIWDVLPQESLVLEEHSALNLSTNDLLLPMLNGWEGASVSVEVKARETRADSEEEQGTQRKWAPKRRRVAKRKKPVARCPPRNFKCLNEGCNFQDTGEQKRDKHSTWFCSWRNKCYVCKDALRLNTQWQDHYCRLCPVVIPAESGFSVSPKKDHQFFLVETAAGRVVCECIYSHYFYLCVRTPVLYEQLYRYRCEVRLQSADTTWTYIPETLYDRMRDWEVKCKDEVFNLFTNDVVVRIIVHSITT